MTAVLDPWLLDITAEERRAAYADALLILIRAGEIIKGEGQAAMDALGLSMEDMSAARTRADRRRTVPAPPIPTPDPAPPAPGPPSARSAPPTPAPPTGQTYHPKASRQRARLDDGRLHCPRHDDGKGAWLPPESFALRTDHTTPESDGHRRSWCRGCVARYQSERYLSVRAVRNSEAVIVTYLHQPNVDPEVICSRCRKPISPNEAVMVESFARHEVCPT